MNDGLRKMARTVQTWFPWAADAKYAAQRAARRLCRRPFEADFRALRLLDLGPAPLVIDVGANRGQSIDALRLLVPRAHVIAFEPNPGLAEQLRHRYRHERRVDVVPFGLGDRSGLLDLAVPHYNGFPFDGLASFDEAAVGGWLQSRIVGYAPARLRIARIGCAVRRLDELGLDPALIKVDVQGFERQMLLGARETLRRARPALLVEGPDGLTVEYLHGLGYRPHAYREGRLVPGELGAQNTFFLAAGGPGVLTP